MVNLRMDSPMKNMESDEKFVLKIEDIDDYYLLLCAENLDIDLDQIQGVDSANINKRASCLQEKIFLNILSDHLTKRDFDCVVKNLKEFYGKFVTYLGTYSETNMVQLGDGKKSFVFTYEISDSLIENNKLEDVRPMQVRKEFKPSQEIIFKVLKEVEDGRIRQKEEAEANEREEAEFLKFLCRVQKNTRYQAKEWNEIIKDFKSYTIPDGWECEVDEDKARNVLALNMYEKNILKDIYEFKNEKY